MKIRTGFVSNSSSSSFIIGYGVIKNEKEVLSYLKKNGIEFSTDVNDWKECKIVHSLELSQMIDHNLSVSNNTNLTIPNSLEDKNNLIIIVEIGNNEGDEFFRDYDHEYNLDYEKANNIEFWDGYQRKLIELFNDNSLIGENNIIFGAERNG